MPDKVVEGYQLSPQQARIWLLQQLDGSLAYRAQCAVLIEGALDVGLLRAAICEIVARHEILRTGFHLLAGMTIPLQAIEEESVAALREIDLSDCDAQQKSVRFEEILQEEAVDCLDFKRGLRARFCLAQMSAAEGILVMSLPAVCVDSRSLKNLFREIARAYGAQRRGEDNTEQPVQYVDFVEWQRERLERQEDRSERLKGGDARLGESCELKLGLERESERESKFAPKSVRLALDGETVGRIDRVSEAHRITPDVFLLSCWQALVWRLSGNKDVTINSLCEGRGRGKLQQAMGAFASYSPVQCHLEPDYRLEEMLETVDRSCRWAQGRVDQILREEWAPIGDGGVGKRACGISFEYEEWPGAEQEGGVKFSYWRQYCCIDRFKLKLGAYRREEALEIEIGYEPAIYADESIELMEERYQKVIESALRREVRQIADWEVIGKREQERLIVGWNRTERRDDEDRCIHELIGEQARIGGEAIAVNYREEQLSFAELERRAERLAGDLRGMGVGPERVVGLYVERSTEMMIGLLGILKAGGAYLPLEVGNPGERLRAMLEEAGARVVVTRSEDAGSLAWCESEVVMVDGESVERESCGEEEERRSVSAENLAYVIYTSGSTGKPKGVMVRHGAVVNLLKGLKETVYEGEEEGVTVSLNAPLSFDASVKQVAQLANGSRLCIVPEEERLDGREMLKYMRRNGVEVMDCTPSQWRVLKEAGLEKSESGVRVVLVGGEAIDGESWREMRESREIRYYNVYGPTECTVDATVCGVKECREPTIGSPIRNTRIYILDERGEMAPTGVTGEIYIGGEGLGRGYIGDAWQTAERFVPDPYVKGGGERMYRTGDRGRYVEGGRIEYEGRRDGQVKVRGHRIELGEIEEVLRSYPGVREAVVTVREDALWQKRLVGYVVGRQECGVEGKRRQLPNGMVIVEQNKNETEYLYEEIFRKKSYFKHGISLPEGGCVFDVGANIGLFTLFVSQNRKGARVYAFEPIEPIYETLRINAQLYGGAGVKVYQVGLGEEERKEWYTYYRGYSMMSGERRYATATEDIEVIKSYLRNEQASGNWKSLLEEADGILSYRFEEEQYECQVKRLTDVIREEEVERIDILKVDVQRAEMNVLRGLEEADWKKIDQIVMEVHDQESSQTEGRLEEIRRLLKAKGYEVTIEQDELLSGTDRYNLYARRPGGGQKIEEQEWVEMRVDETWDEISEEKLRKYVRESLPDYMAPAAIVVMEEFPLTRNGKIDRGALPRPEEIRKRGEIEESEHRNAYEEIINGVWKAVLKAERVGRRDSFFEIGGDSLSATQVIARVRDVFGVEIGVRSIFNDPTIEGLARVIEEAMRAGEWDDAPPLVRASREERLPLSFAQQRLWFIDQLEPGNAVYNCPGAVKLTGELNLEALERAINEVVRRHEVLRTRIEVEEGEPAQAIDKWEPRRLEVEDLTNLPRETREEEVGRRLREEAEIGFDLSRGPLLKVKVLKLQEDEHVVLFTMHHIVCDAWSMQILSREVGTLYQGYSVGGAGGPSPLAELPIQYADFAVWQREWLKGEVLEEKLAYWREQLAGMEDLELPTDHPRPPAPSYCGASRSFVVERELAERLRELSRREGVTLFMTLLGGFNVLMSRYSWQTDVAIGTDIANRNRAEIEGLIGFFVNQLVLRVEVRARESFVDFVKRVRDVCLGAYAHQDLPFEKLVEELRPERDLSRSPLFQVKLIWQNAPGEGLELGGARPVSSDGGEVRMANEARSARFDLTVSITDGRHDLVGAVIYSRDLFEEGTIERLMSHYTNVLRGIVDDSESPIFSLSLLSAEEREQIVVGWNETGKPYPNDRRIHELVAEQAERTPERIALVYEGQQVSYGELNRRANQLGHYLRRLGVGPEVVVGVCLERSVEMVVAVLGALKAGGAYLPLDTGSPAERMGYMLEDAGAVVVLTDGRLEERLPAIMAQAVLMDEEREKISEEGESEPESEVGAENLAYVIYTSGSSGRPKGVMIEHQGLCNLAEAQKEAFGLGGQSRVLQFASLSFDASISEIFTTLISGGSLHVYAQQSLMLADELVKVLKEAQITTVTLPPTVLAMLPHEELLNLQTLIAAGEACTTEIVERWARGRKFLDAYGPTEITVCASIGECKAGNDRRPTIGRPMANTQLYILDPEMEPVPAEIRGELYISGIGLARGYLGRPDLTAERFLPNLFSWEGGARLYRTGDLGRYLSDGNVDFMGRSDGQVKIRGCRVELGEVEAVLNEHRSVKQSAVIASDNERGGRRLLGYVVVEDGATAAELKKHARERLPEYMVPESILVMKEMPVTASGKIDRKKLPLMEDVGRQVEQPYVGARTPIDEILVGIFEDVLKLSRIGICDNFFEIGGHSLLATQVISRVRKAFGVEVGVKRMFENATIEGLARAIEEAMRAGEQDGAPPLVRVSREERLPLSFAQQRLWFIDQLEPGNAVYNCPGAVKLTGELKLEVLERVINEILRRHEVLRTRIEVEAGEPAQVIDEWEPRRLEVKDLTGLTREEKVAEVSRMAREEAETGFDLSRGPLMRVKVLKLGAQEHVVLYTMHHIVSDAWSLAVLVREVGVLYEAMSEGKGSPLPELEIQYADYAKWQREYLSGEVLEREVGYWKGQLQGAAVMELPTDHARPSAPSHRGGYERIEIGDSLSKELRRVSQEEGATLFMALMAAFKALMMRYSGEEDISVGTAIANRTRREVEGLIGFFVNTLVMRTDLSGNPSFRELVKREQGVALGAYAHQEVPFEKLVEELNPERDLSRSPLFQVMMIMQNGGEERWELKGLRLSGIRGEGETGEEGRTAKFDLTVSIRDMGDGLEGVVNYSRDLFEGETIERLIGHYRNVLDGIVKERERPIGWLSLLSEGERKQIVEEWNETEAPYGEERLIHELFEEQVERSPEAVALIYEEQSLSYGELNRRANRLAHHLRELGVGPEAPVAICVERSEEMLVALLGVMKAGGAYLPLDPAYPDLRLSRMLEDAEVRVVVSEVSLEGKVSGAGRRVVRLDAEEAEIDRQAEENPEVGVGSGNLAYVIYTSGSTGKPKGVEIEHRALVNFLQSMSRRPGMREGEKLLAVTTISFDIAGLELYLPLLVGGEVEVLSREEASDGLLLGRRIAESGARLMQATPATWGMLVDAGWKGGEGLKALCGGEATPKELGGQLLQRCGELWNVYGPTETTIWSAARKVERWEESGLIGDPIANTQIYILNQDQEPAPVGVRGEIYISGEGVARGYVGSPELTGEKFTPNPFSRKGGERWYRTGDHGRYRADGNIEFLGRADDQVKIRGFRIELGEIEARMREMAEVREAVVVAREEREVGKRLVAYYTGAEVGAEALRGHLLSSLPEYMVPAAYAHLERLPLTANGKVDRRALPEADGVAYLRRDYEAPVGETETKLAQIWAETLKLERVGRHDNFFELGGHSLLAVKMIERLRRAGLPTDIRRLFVAPTLQALAEAIEGASRVEVEAPPNLIPLGCRRITPEMLPLVELTQEEIDAVVARAHGGAANVQDIYPLTALQEGILFHHLMNTQGGAYLSHLLLAFDTRERLEAVLGALREVIARHDILRTAVVWEGLREPVQVVWREAPLPVEEVALDESKGEAPDQLRARFDPRRQRLDVRQAPLMRCIVTYDAARGQWLLLWLSHHLTTDHMAMEVMIREAQAALLGEIDRLPAPLPFRNLVAQARLRRERREDEEFFREMLGSVEEPTAPYGLLEVQGDGSEAEQARMELDATLARRLKERAREMGVSAASVCHVAWGRVVGRVTGREDVVFGTVLFGRMGGGEGAERALGLFINTLPIRVGVGRESVERSVRRTQEALGGLMRREHASLAVAQRCSGVEAPAPLFSCLLNYRHSPREVKRSRVGREAWVGMEVLESGERTNYPLTLSVDDRGDGFGLTAQAIRPIDPGRICEYMRKALEGLVEALERAPETEVRSIEVAPEGEMRQILEEWNETEAEYPRERCVHELFEEQVERSPEAVALVYEEEHLSYRALNGRANLLAHYLRELGVGPEVLVGLCVERSLRMVVGVWGVLKAGGAYLPLDPGYPVERLAYLLEEAKAPVVLSEGGIAERLPAGWAQTVLLDEWEQREAEAESEVEAGSGAENAAYVIYTSGSSGRPKGVWVTHRGLTNYLWWARKSYEAEWGGVVSSSLSFDATVTSLLTPLISGGAVRLVREGREIEGLEEEVSSRQGVGIVKITPGHLEALGQRLRVEGVRSLVRVYVIGGEALSVSTVELWRAMEPGVRMVNEYGPSETVVGCVVYEVRPEVELRRSVPIGGPIANTRIYALDREGRPAPVGVGGEIYIGGTGVGRGYLNRPELTAERFLPDPFGGEPGGRLYQTGDLGRRLPEGEIEFLGRNDNQVKIRGYRIELGEIEARVAEQAEVREAVVVARDEGEGGKRLVAYYTGEEIRAEALRRRLSEALPEYMIPAAYVHLESLPLTANGKLDRRALPAPEGDAYVRRGYEAPEGETESELAGIWGELLKVERVGRRDNFFELGGHSLLAVQVLSRLQQTLGVEVALADLFAHPVLADLARKVECYAQVELPPITPVNRNDRLELSFAQQRLWFIDQLEGASDAYHIAGGLRLTGDLDRQALRRALDRIVARHEALRTTFSQIDGEPIQVIGSAEKGFQLQEHDLRQAADAAGALRQMVEREAREPFDLEVGPLIRGRLAQLGEEDHALLVTMHHIVSDGWSMGILVNELSALYRAYREGEEADLVELPIQYADYVAWQRSWLQGHVLEDQLAYWRRQLAGELPVLELPTDKPRPAIQTYRGAQHSQMLPTMLSDSLKALGLEQSCTLFMTLLAAFKILLYYLTGQTDICVGTTIANRNRAEIQKLIGFFVNQLVLRTELTPNSTFEELLGKVREITLGAYGRQDLPFEKLVEALNPNRDANRTPLFQVKMVLQNAPVEELSLPGLKLSSIATTTGTAKFDLLLFLHDTERGLSASLQYNADLFEESTPRRILNRFHTLLDRIVERPDTRLQELVESLIEQDEREQEEKKSELKAIRRRKLKNIERKAIGASYAEAEQCKDNLSHVAEKIRPITVRRKPSSVVREGLVTIEPQNGGESLPLVMRPSVEGVDLAVWAPSNREFIKAHLLKHGGILFRNFSISLPDEFERFAIACSDKLLPYREPSSPRTRIKDNIYTSTDYPADQSIFLHNEHSYRHTWPLKIFFFCLEPSAQGGETPIADCRKVFKRIDPKIRRRFIEKGWMLVRNFGDGLSLTWQSVFQTEDKLAVEAYCREAGIEIEWRGERLRTRQARQAVAQHPSTGEMVWFNHATFFHVSTLEPSTREVLLGGLEEEDLPANTYYGDGSPIEHSILEEMREAYRRETVSFAWQKGDILMLDNMLVAHGRNPYVGPRRILVAMAEPFGPIAATLR